MILRDHASALIDLLSEPSLVSTRQASSTLSVSSIPLLSCILTTCSTSLQRYIRQDHMYEQPSAPYPGPNPNYGQPAPYYNPPEQPILYNGDSKDPYEGGRFKPKKTINDPVFLALFILQVKLHCVSCFCLPLLTFLGKKSFWASLHSQALC
jgi:hypothetical protein